MDASATIRPENEGKAVKEMLSLELVGVIGLLFGLVAWAMVVTQRERRGATIFQRGTEAQKVVKGV